MSEIEKLSTIIIKAIDESDVNKILKVKVMLLIYKMLESESVFDDNIKILEEHRKKMIK